MGNRKAHLLGWSSVTYPPGIGKNSVKDSNEGMRHEKKPPP